MRTKHHTLILSAMRKILRPLLRILLRNGIPYGTFADLAKQVYVDVASEDCTIPGRKHTISRMSVMTGLSRKEVRRVKTLALPDNPEATSRYHRAARVISGWVRDGAFSDGRGQPADLPMEGEGATFSRLVKRFSGDVPARAVLDELIRVGAVERTPEGPIRLLTRAYLPRMDAAAGFEILGADVRDLVRTVDHNLRAPGNDRIFQRKVSYDNLPGEVVAEFRNLVAHQGQSYLEEMDRWLAQYDRDTNPYVRGAGRKRAGIGIYYFEEDMTEEGEPS